MTNDKIPRPSEVNAENIIRPSFDEISEDCRQVFEALQKERQEQMKKDNEARMKRQAELDMKTFLASCSKDRHGKIIPPEKIELPPLPASSTEPAVSSSLFSEDQLAKINSLITKSSQQTYEAALQNIKAMKNTCPSSIGANASIEKPTSWAPPRSTPINSSRRQIRRSFPISRGL